jgi:hypothetical protein
MTTLNQILAVEKNKKTALNKEISDLHHRLEKPDQVTGHHKVYTSSREDDETFPDEVRRVQVLHHEAIEQICALVAPMLDVTATKDWANCNARADVKVNGQVFLENVPVTFLLCLEKELRDLHTFVEKIVELDPGEAWTFDANSGQYRSDPVKTSKTKKLQKPVTLYDATEHHPAQCQLITEDVVIGHWTTTKFSGAMPRPKKKEILDRIRVLEDAVKYAREQANAMDVADQKVGKKFLSYIFSGPNGA